MSDKKRISINPAFLKGSNFKKTIKKKEKPKMPIKASTLKQKLISKVKEKNKKTYENEKREQKQKEQKECIIEEDEFNKSLSYLQEKIKKQKEKQKEKKKEKKHRNPENNNDYGLNNISLNNVINNLNISNKEKCETIIIKPEPPHGCLKNGKKPTYRSYNGIKNPIKKKCNSLKISNYNSYAKKNNSMNLFFQRQEKLKKLKKKETKKKIKRKTIKTKRTLGKNKNKKVNILIKNNTSRRQVESEKNLLKSATLSEIKQYLKKQGIIKHGSTAPGEMLREMYESCILTGEVENKCGGVLLHNYFNEET